MNKFIIEDARRLGFNLTIEYGTIKKDFQYLGYLFVTDNSEYWNKKKRKERGN